MKTLLKGGQNTCIFLEGTNQEITEFVVNNLNKFNLNEEYSCIVDLWGDEIQISGDEDLVILTIKEVKPIKL